MRSREFIDVPVHGHGRGPSGAPLREAGTPLGNGVSATRDRDRPRLAGSGRPDEKRAPDAEGERDG